MNSLRMGALAALSFALVAAACSGGSSETDEPPALPTQTQPNEMAMDTILPVAADEIDDDFPPEIKPDQEPAAIGSLRVDEVMEVRAAVVRVIDGDTITVGFDDGTTETVRLIGIDAPEIGASGEAAEPLGSEASALNAKLLASGEVFLERDVTDRDRFGRLLRYVYAVDASGSLIFVNAALVRAGFASVLTVSPDVRYVDLLVVDEEAAQTDGLGIWASAEGGEP
jgi:micrococcal nuclease